MLNVYMKFKPSRTNQLRQVSDEREGMGRELWLAEGPAALGMLAVCCALSLGLGGS